MRLTELRKRTVTEYAQDTFRHGTPGGTKFTVGFLRYDDRRRLHN